MDHLFTEKLGAWLATPAPERDAEAGAIMLLRLSGNIIEHRRLMTDPASKMEYIEMRLQKYYDFRVQDLTHSQVKEMEAEAAEALKRNISLTVKAESAPRGKRRDHDQLPEEIQGLYVENLDLLRRMRELHLQLRKMSTETQVCPDSERYPFLKELIAADKKLRGNWETYDNYVNEGQVSE